jgi:hypothetical protein
VTRVRALVPVLLLAALTACGPDAPLSPTQNYGTIQGRVYDATSNAGVAGVVVTVDTLDTATTDAQGHYQIPNIPLGEYDLVVGPVTGYTVGAIPDANGSIVAGQTIEIDVPLTKQ